MFTVSNLHIIENIKEGDKVLTHDGSFQKVLNTHVRDASEVMLRVKTEYCENDEYVFKIAKRSDLIGKYLGHTAIKTQELIDKKQEILDSIYEYYNFTPNSILFVGFNPCIFSVRNADIYLTEATHSIQQYLIDQKQQ